MRSFLSAVAASLVLGGLCVPLAGAADWASAGANLRNSRSQSDESRISPSTVAGLNLKWTVATEGDVTANPALDAEHLYFPDSAGFLYKVRRSDGALVWKRSVAGYTGLPGDHARATPAIAGDLLIFGNNSGKSFTDPRPARVLAVDKVTGDLRWITQVDSTFMSFVTHSAIVSNGIAYVGIASNEELVAAFVPKAFWQWTFRGSVVALDVRTGAIRWKTYMVPPGYHGGAIWGSTGAIDHGRKLLYVATGNNYAVPQEVLDCLAIQGTASACMSPENHFDSIVALDIRTGAIRWATRGLPYDAWNVGCGLSVPGFVIQAGDNCPNPAGPDHDFAQGPILLDGQRVGAGQKSGVFWALDADTGALAWKTDVSPGGLTGGLQWGSAAEGRRVFVAVSNSGPTGAGQRPGAWLQKDGSTSLAGGWAALDRRTGEVLWTTPDPNGARAEAAVSVANGVVFGCNLDYGRGAMRALDARTGKVLWTYDSGAPCNAGPSIADGMVFWGSGTFIGAPGARKLFAFGF